MFSLYRAPKQPDFSDEEVQTIRDLLPIISIAMTASAGSTANAFTVPCLKTSIATCLSACSSWIGTSN